jgi:MFS family permease
VQIFRSLAHSRFRHYFFGQTISVIGFWLQSVAQSWLMYRLTDSPVMLGLVAFAGFIPMLVLSPFAGLLTDRVDRRAIVLTTQSLQMVQALALAILTFGGWIEPEQIIWLALVQGIANTFDGPARHSLLPVMVGGTEDLHNAIALNSLVMNLGRFAGPAVAGALLVWVGEGWCFLLNAVSYLAVLASLSRLPSSRASAASGSWHKQLSEGFLWVKQLPVARALALNLVLVSLCAPNYQTLMPVFASEVFGGDARTQGLLISCAGAGALVGTMMLAARASVAGLARVINLGSLAAGFGLTVFALTDSLALAAPALAAVGFGVIVTGAGTNTMLQSLVEERLRGRIISLYMMGFLGTMPVGGLMLGGLAAHIGPQSALALFGLVSVASALLLWTRQGAIAASLEVRARGLGHCAADSSGRGD